MAKFLCFFTLLTSKKKKLSKKESAVADAKQAKSNENQRVKPEELLFELLPAHNTVEKLIPSADVVIETDYEGGDEKDEKVSMKRDLSDLDLQSKVELNSPDQDNSTGSSLNHPTKTIPEIPTPTRRQSDPGAVQEMSNVLPNLRLLKRSCSNIERKSAAWTESSVNKSRSYGNLASLPDTALPKEKPSESPLSVKTACSADRVMLKKRSSSQVLPSRSRKLWWRLFLWSHRNLHRPNWVSTITAPARPESVSDMSNNNKGGYTSDTLETSEVVDKKKKKVIEDPTNQWVAFSAETSYLDRVSAWVNSIPNNEDENESLGGHMCDEFFYPNLTEVGESSGKSYSHVNKKRGADEVLQANNVIQSLNILSSVAHISGMGLNVVPAISSFTSLKAVNLSSNFIVHIPSGALPKSLHALDLSRNKIVAIEGLRELTRLRVLNLSYNRISRIGQGLSNCTAIKELYLAGNKISDVEGLHRLLKLTVLDLSFNKITTTKALGQLVANYNSLLALNLLGNPIQSNIGDEQLKKAVSGLLPKVAYLNKQPVKPQRGRDVTTDRVAKAALGNTGWDSRRKTARRLSQGAGSGSFSRSGRSAADTSSHRGKSRHRK
ncbi:Outer arm dynein light chain 1 protein [Rhynchospora pubera]|uniref:Outer arm dynein light chain 1 protein n=1 Tax=Rhynchospora pubera TaxID=906938 RepID=A0AAV8C4T9_9POAL|nr:Outer arm dynein light chain 1 protein [Rhynchospora pubera]